MGRRSLTGGVRAKGDRIEFTFFYQGQRYRPTLPRIPSEANLRRARQHLADIKGRIKQGTFVFSEEFPDYRYAEEQALADAAAGVPQAPKERTCNQVFDAFLKHCEMRVAQKDMAFATLDGYRKILNRTWRPTLGERPFKQVVYSDMIAVAAAQKWQTKKTYNNGISPLRCAFEFGYKDHPELHNPADGLDSLRITKKDRPKVDPFTIYEAEAIIAAIHRDWGEAQGNYDEFRFFTGLRPSEQIALTVSDCDLVQAKILIDKARVMRQDKDRTKNYEDRIIELCPRAVEVLKRQLALRARMRLAGKIPHEDVFFREDGSAIRSLNDPYDCWRWTLKRLKVRYREPYNARHSSVSWNLMLGKNLLWVSKQHGHSVQMMLSTYAAWLEGSQPGDIAAIEAAMNGRCAAGRVAELGCLHTDSPESPEFATSTPPTPGQRSVSRGFRKEIYGGKGGTRTLDPGIMSAVL